MRHLLPTALLALALTACGGGDDEPSGEDKVDVGAAAEACSDEVQESLDEETMSGPGLEPETVMRVGDGGDTVTVAPLQQADFLVMPSVVAGLCVMGELDAPDSVQSTVSQATGLSGQNEVEWDGVKMTYSYNGNVGLSAVFTAS